MASRKVIVDNGRTSRDLKMRHVSAGSTKTTVADTAYCKQSQTRRLRGSSSERPSQGRNDCVALTIPTTLSGGRGIRYAHEMGAKGRPPRARPSELLPIIKPLLEPVVEPVLERLARTEELLQELKVALDIQFKRTAQIQAQLDMLVARLGKQRK